jgi:hypothetical protein
VTQEWRRNAAWECVKSEVLVRSLNRAVLLGKMLCRFRPGKRRLGHVIASRETIA